jgi:Zn-dependent protease with chaperone function
MTLQEQIRSARLRTVVVLAAFMLLVAAIVAAVYVGFGEGYGLIVLLVAIGYGFFAYVAAGSIVAIIMAPIGAALLQMTLSRRREYLADASAAELTGDPEGLARALWKLGADHTPLRKVNRATAHMWIESPLRDHHGLRSGLSGLFETHPPLQKRISRLEEMGGFSLPAVPKGGAE